MSEDDMRKAMREAILERQTRRRFHQSLSRTLPPRYVRKHASATAPGIRQTRRVRRHRARMARELLSRGTATLRPKAFRKRERGVHITPRLIRAAAPAPECASCGAKARQMAKHVAFRHGRPSFEERA